MGRQARGAGRKAPTVAGALAAFSRDLGLIVDFARELRAGSELKVALGSLEKRAKASWASEEAHAGGTPTAADARAFAAGVAELVRSPDGPGREIEAHAKAEKRIRSRRKRSLG